MGCWPAALALRKLAVAAVPICMAEFLWSIPSPSGSLFPPLFFCFCFCFSFFPLWGGGWLRITTDWDVD
ncbi:uncharacterized protein BO72DRAFT_40229 [Aspergillus fijiensis CBS 313.89]|uniref:Uncharacterized protein n=1 Tax=Aspergillus fijiensis CBS 313.89 TaxID=1448319 RepID=A0A8G1RFK1_9EURO|nr:uncharacterized protein BO72DRAFT_40229 [Aspergillus fijiensis CBS 313.89]RAK70885.1 hypothetical protein BO72DRAFT_40229 [Aspergillus fijiensis CBS 313.89]